MSLFNQIATTETYNLLHVISSNNLELTETTFPDLKVLDTTQFARDISLLILTYLPRA